MITLRTLLVMGPATAKLWYPVLVYDNYVEEVFFASTIWFPYAMPITFIIPLIMLVVAKVRWPGRRDTPDGPL